MECITRLEREISDLRKTLLVKENELYELKKKWLSKPQDDPHFEENTNGYTTQARLDKLPRWAIERYSRQILLPEIGVEGQVRLGAARVLVAGAGGLGCPAAAYLAGAGVGEIGLVDYDTVDVTNIHRQILHGEADQGMNKVDSAANALRRINSNITITTHNVQLDSNLALQLVSRYHVILDCSDNVPTRYLLNDACAIAKLPLISGSALKMEGQLTVYGYRAPKEAVDKAYQGPCYRCLFPSPPPPETVGSCSANGVAGPVPGVIGALQALEAIKLVVGRSHGALLVERMLVFDGDDATFRTVKLRPRNGTCAACSETPTITKLLDYEAFCKAKAKEKDLDLQILPPTHRLSANELASRLARARPLLVDVRGEAECNLSTTFYVPIYTMLTDLDLQILPPTHRLSANELASRLARARPLLVDVRSAAEFAMCRIEGAVNWPGAVRSLPQALLDEMRNSEHGVTFVCRRGNDSQLAARNALDAGVARVSDLAGGLRAWARDADPTFPVY